MSPGFWIYRTLGICAVMSLGACILVPEGDGGGHGGHDRDDHEHRDHDHDHDDEHRHDFGVVQKERLGLHADPRTWEVARDLHAAVFVPDGLGGRVRAIWA